MNTKPKLLLIDDEPDILLVVGMLLRTEGFDVSTAESGAQGLEMMNENKYDLVISDYLMPYMDGVNFLKKVREKKDFTPFIFFSGNANESHEVKMVGLGAYQLLPKTQLNDLKDVIRKTLNVAEKMKDLDAGKTKETDEFLNLLYSVG